jgi:AAA domain
MYVLSYVLGAPGSGKTTVTALLRGRLPAWTVVDWDAFMDAATALAGRDIRKSPETWPSYRSLVREVVGSIEPHPTVLLGVCTPDELADWPIAAWVLLDCSDDERTQRLATHRSRREIESAVDDARRYRSYELPVVDTTGRSLEEVATALANLLSPVDGSASSPAP